MKPIIGILLRPILSNTEREVSSIYNSVRDAILVKGGLPLGIVMPHLETLTEDEKKDLYRTTDFCDGMIAQGGDDFYPYELEVLQYTYDKNIPTLGICLGMQAMSVLKNGEMEDIQGTINHNQKGTDYVHAVQIQKDTVLYKILKKETIFVNSRHNSQVTHTDLEVGAMSSDSIIEAVEDSTKTFFIGVQWHPEDMLTYDTVENILFDYFINICKR